MKFTEAQLEQAIIELLGEEDYTHVLGETIQRDLNEVLIKDDLRSFLHDRYARNAITSVEIEQIIHKLEVLPASDLYGSNKDFMKLVSDGFLLKREDPEQKDLFVHLIDYSNDAHNLYKIVSQMEIFGFEKRIPDGIIYINGLPLVIFEFKSAMREEATIHNAYIQLTVRYRRDIPELLKYNAFCVISDGVNTKMGSLFAKYEYFYAWRKIDGNEHVEKQGIDSLYTMVKGLFNKYRLRNVIHNFIFFPDSSKKEEKVVCSYPQY
ncbi:MAG: type I restriction endonuclease, partial [Dehalococcoidales bacterium]